MKALSISVFILIFFSHFAIAAEGPPVTQHTHGTDQAAESPAMPDMASMSHALHHSPATFIDAILHHSTAGTSAQPNSADEPMIMRP
ncbi:MAG TPA: hypothetical protein VFF39_06875, partial [Verrucomicrobiae bacterium]|nr:hypothetical protein [Verrucomicrobiae bacterium]